MILACWIADRSSTYHDVKESCDIGSCHGFILFNFWPQTRLLFSQFAVSRQLIYSQGAHMVRKSMNAWLFSICVALCTAILPGIGTAKEGIPAFSVPDSIGKQSEPSQQPQPLPDSLKNSENHETLAGIDDSQVKRGPVQELGKPAQSKVNEETPSGAVGISAFIDRMEDNIDLFSRKIVEIFYGRKVASQIFSEWFQMLLTKEGHEHLIRILVAILGLLLAGIASERFFKRYAYGVYKRIIRAETTSDGVTVFTRNKLLMIDLTAVTVFATATTVIYFAFFNYSETTRWIFITYLAIVLIIKGVCLLARFFLSPNDASSRLIKLSSESATMIYRWITRITAVGVSGLLIGEFLELQGMSEELDELVQGLAGTIVIAMMIYLIVAYRQPVTAMIFKDRSDDAAEATRTPSLVAALWHIPTIIYLILVWFSWLFYLVVRQADVIIPILVTLGSVPLYWMCNRLVQKLFRSVSAALQIPNETLPPEEKEARRESGEAPEQKMVNPFRERTVGSRFAPFLSRALSVAIALVIGCWLLQLWGIFPGLGDAVMLAVLEILLTVSMAFVGWRWIELAIERRVSKVQAGQEEAGSGSRVVTILQILRKFILIILLSVVGLIVLSTIGIDIKPLLAGAGVIGLAFGLGTQSLIKDIVSGMFFLMDDAFRIGDYIESGKIKGTVESIHIRSLKLRHSRGMIHTVPFSQLGSVTNFSRDYLVSKIEFRVPYGTDINKVKKLVKKINEGVEQDKDLGPNLLSPIKSIGVKGFDELGLIMAVKFSSKPSRQSELRRYVLQGLQESFGKHGLEFAHRHVVVRLPEGAAAEKHETSVMPPDGPNQPPPKEILSAGAAAAITAALSEAENKEK